MAVHTPLPLPEARALARRWGLSVASVEGIPAGSVNSSYALHLDDGTRVFLRLYETRTVDSAAEETRMLAHLAREGVPTPEPLPLVDDPTRSIVAYEGKPAAVFPWSEGHRAPCTPTVPSVHAPPSVVARRKALRAPSGVELETPLVYLSPTTVSSDEPRYCVPKAPASISAATRWIPRRIERKFFSRSSQRNHAR